MKKMYTEEQLKSQVESEKKSALLTADIEHKKELLGQATEHEKKIKEMAGAEEARITDLNQKIHDTLEQNKKEREELLAKITKKDEDIIAKQNELKNLEITAERRKTQVGTLEDSLSDLKRTLEMTEREKLILSKDVATLTDSFKNLETLYNEKNNALLESYSKLADKEKELGLNTSTQKARDIIEGVSTKQEKELKKEINTMLSALKLMEEEIGEGSSLHDAAATIVDGYMNYKSGNVQKFVESLQNIANESRARTPQELSDKMIAEQYKTWQESLSKAGKNPLQSPEENLYDLNQLTKHPYGSFGEKSAAFERDIHKINDLAPRVVGQRGVYSRDLADINQGAQILKKIQNDLVEIKNENKTLEYEEKVIKESAIEAFNVAERLKLDVDVLRDQLNKAVSSNNFVNRAGQLQNIVTVLQKKVNNYKVVKQEDFSKTEDWLSSLMSNVMNTTNSLSDTITSTGSRLKELLINLPELVAQGTIDAGNVGALLVPLGKQTVIMAETLAQVVGAKNIDLKDLMMNDFSLMTLLGQAYHFRNLLKQTGRSLLHANVNLYARGLFASSDITGIHEGIVSLYNGLEVLNGYIDSLQDSFRENDMEEDGSVTSQFSSSIDLEIAKSLEAFVKHVGEVNELPLDELNNLKTILGFKGGKKLIAERGASKTLTEKDIESFQKTNAMKELNRALDTFLKTEGKTRDDLTFEEYKLMSDKLKGSNKSDMLFDLYEQSISRSNTISEFVDSYIKHNAGPKIIPILEKYKERVLLSAGATISRIGRPYMTTYLNDLITKQNLNSNTLASFKKLNSMETKYENIPSLNKVYKNTIGTVITASALGSFKYDAIGGIFASEFNKVMPHLPKDIVTNLANLVSNSVLVYSNNGENKSKSNREYFLSETLLPSMLSIFNESPKEGNASFLEALVHTIATTSFHILDREAAQIAYNSVAKTRDPNTTEIFGARVGKIIDQRLFDMSMFSNIPRALSTMSERQSNDVNTLIQIIRYAGTNDEKSADEIRGILNKALLDYVDPSDNTVFGLTGNDIGALILTGHKNPTVQVIDNYLEKYVLSNEVVDINNMEVFLNEIMADTFIANDNEMQSLGVLDTLRLFVDRTRDWLHVFAGAHENYTPHVTEGKFKGFNVPKNEFGTDIDVVGYKTQKMINLSDVISEYMYKLITGETLTLSKKEATTRQFVANARIESQKKGITTTTTTTSPYVLEQPIY